MFMRKIDMIGDQLEGETVTEGAIEDNFQKPESYWRIIFRALLWKLNENGDIIP